MDEALPFKLAGLSVYLIALLAIGVIASRRMKGAGDYFAAGKNLSFWSVAFSSRATGESGWLPLGLTGCSIARIAKDVVEGFGGDEVVGPAEQGLVVGSLDSRLRSAGQDAEPPRAKAA